MSHKFGFRAMTNQALTNKAGSGNSSSPTNEEFIVRVTSINLDPSEGFTKIGSLSGEKINSKGILTGRIYKDIRPSDPYRKSFPLINEYVKVAYVIAPNSTGGQFVYDGPISLYGAVSPNANPNPNPLINPLPTSQQVNYSQVQNGAYNIQNNTPQTLELNSSTNPDRATFEEKSNIHPLLPYAGDIIYEGRWGNSIRFGSTAKILTNYSNNWSSIGTNGDPITILRNGQDPNSSNFGAEPIIENIQNDLSSIYLTSYQKIPFSLANENFISYIIPPTTPSQFANPQIILNSNRIAINAKSDSVLISGEKSVGISSNGSVNIDAVSHYISSNDIKLGSKNATQPVLLGDNTVEILIQLTEAIKSLASILQVQRDYPGGVLATSYNAIAGNILTQINDPSNGILAQLNNNSLKSQTTKVQ
jgi:hypothetical protein